MRVNSPISAHENQFNCEKVRFFSKMSKTHLLALLLEKIFVSSSWGDYVRINLDIKNKTLEWYE